MDGLYPGPEAFAGLVTAPVFKIGEAFKPNAWWVRFPSASANRRGDNPLRGMQGRTPRGEAKASVDAEDRIAGGQQTPRRCVDVGLPLPLTRRRGIATKIM